MSFKKIHLIRKEIQELDIDWFNDRISHNSILFIDSTHTVKSGSDCLYLNLNILPDLKATTYVHSHDIHLPIAVSKDWLLELQIHWTEQYLLYAYLLENHKAQVLFSSAYAKQFLPDLLNRFMHGRYQSGGGSLWFQLN